MVGELIPGGKKRQSLSSIFCNIDDFAGDDSDWEESADDFTVSLKGSYVTKWKYDHDCSVVGTIVEKHRMKDWEFGQTESVAIMNYATIFW